MPPCDGLVKGKDGCQSVSSLTDIAEEGLPMAKLKFGAWVPSYSWPDVGPDHTKKLTAAIKKCEEYGIDVWVIDHLLSAPGLDVPIDAIVAGVRLPVGEPVTVDAAVPVERDRGRDGPVDSARSLRPEARRVALPLRISGCIAARHGHLLP